MPIFGGKPLPLSRKLPDLQLFPIGADESRRKCSGFDLMQKENTAEVDVQNADRTGDICTGPRSPFGFGSVACWGHCASSPFAVTSPASRWLSGKQSVCNSGDVCLIPGSGRSPGEGKGNPLQCSCLRIPWTEEPSGLQSMGLQRVGHN